MEIQVLHAKTSKAGAEKYGKTWITLNDWVHPEGKPSYWPDLRIDSRWGARIDRLLETVEWYDPQRQETLVVVWSLSDLVHQDHVVMALSDEFLAKVDRPALLMRKRAACVAVVGALADHWTLHPRFAILARETLSRSAACH